MLEMYALEFLSTGSWLMLVFQMLFLGNNEQVPKLVLGGVIVADEKQAASVDVKRATVRKKARVIALSLNLNSEID
jgi:hypothetical protein